MAKEVEINKFVYSQFKKIASGIILTIGHYRTVKGAKFDVNMWHSIKEKLELMLTNVYHNCIALGLGLESDCVHVDDKSMNNIIQSIITDIMEDLKDVIKEEGKDSVTPPDKP